VGVLAVPLSLCLLVVSLLCPLSSVGGGAIPLFGASFSFVRGTVQRAWWAPRLSRRCRLPPSPPVAHRPTAASTTPQCHSAPLAHGATTSSSSSSRH